MRTSSTLWRRKAGGYGGLDFGMVDASSPKGQVSTKSGQLHSDRVSRLVGLMQGVLAGRSATAAVAHAPETVRRTAPTATE